jgi:DNA-binding winged helix-turn-helix (wHTH) protein/tetratricopeptide (TPR) repeat protein
LYEFGAFRLDPAERLLLREGQPIRLTGKALDALLVLVRANGHLIEKSDLISALWGQTIVEEGNLTVLIWQLRKALGDDVLEHKYIQTVAKRGYRFVAEVRQVVEVNPAQIRSLAVIPFRSLSADVSQDHLGIGLADTIITKLGSMGQIIVRPTTAVIQYFDKRADPLTIGREQQVDAILAGHLEVLSDKVRVTVQLICVRDGSLLWAKSFEDSSHQVFALGDVVAEQIAESTSIRHSVRTEMRSTRQNTRDPKAYRLYLEGRHFWNKRTVEGLRRSIDSFEQAIAKDPQYALAFVGLADSYVLLPSFGIESALKAWPVAKAAAMKALQLDNTLAEAHASLGMVNFYYEWDWLNAEKEFQRAVALNPNYIVAHNWYGLTLAATGRLAEALGEVWCAEAIDPLSLSVNIEVGKIFYWSRKYDMAVAAYRKVIDLNREYARAHSRLGMVHAAREAFDDAIDEFKEAERLSGPDPYLKGLLGYAYACLGNTSEARKMLQELEQRSRCSYVPAFSMVLPSIGLHEDERVFEWLDKSYEDRSTNLIYVKIDPLFDTIRSHPRFVALLHRMGLQ